ncbi:hypothetical protein [Ignatzschineria cameli]|uniref:hypothetical protein n=1 Tax=Ignatzschineria cameli TaxID=2182793 RepID=UPI000D62227A|nr:hypothetical protein [Ignatzschineria cameli]PWD85914.1 hypothetical protein DC080_03895 [Ignatzschineria cameli]
MYKKRLVREFPAEGCDVEFLGDALSVVAANIETSLLEVGAEPGKDYNYMDLYNLAMKYILSKESDSNFASYFLFGPNTVKD